MADMKGSRVAVMRLALVLTTLVSQWICRAEASGVSFPSDDVHPRSLALKSFGKITGPTRIRSRNNSSSQPPHTHSSASSGSLSRYGSTNTANRAWQDIYIAGFFALSEHEIEAALGQGVMPAIKLALQHVANTSFLHDYRLHLLHNDTKCNASVGMKAFFDMMDKQPRKVMILGGSCTSVTDPIAKTSKHWRIPVLSYADTHPMFTRKSYPNFFRVVPSENAFNAPRIKLLQAFNWTRVGTLYQNEPRYALAQNTLVSLLDNAGIELAESQGFVNDLSQPLAKLIEKDVRIILASFNATWARRVFCAVSRTGLYGRHHQWILAGPRQDGWWKEEDPSVNCTSYEILAALEGAFVVDVLPLTSSKEPTISGLTAQQYRTQYDRERGDQYSQFHGYAYDAIWAVAVTIKNVIHKLHERNKHSGGSGARAAAAGPHGHLHNGRSHWSMKDFIYRDAGWEKLILESLRSVNFTGVTGRVHFKDNERMGRLTVKQIVGSHEVQVAEYDNSTDTLQLKERAISWMNKQPPKDRTIQIIEPSRISVSVFATLAIVAGMGIILASTFLAVNIRFRNQRYIKMSSPYLNNLIIIGCLLTYTSVILLGLDSRLSSEAALPMICTARVWTLMAGFTLAFGSMFSKTWRVHSIFTDVKLNKKAIKDYQLFMVVGVLLTIDIAILSTWQIIDPFFRETKLLAPYMHPTEDNVEIQPENEFCQSHYMNIFVGSIYAYKGLLMAFGCFLAWETRNVNIPALNDSKYIGMSVYNVVIMCVFGAVISFILSDQQDVSFIIISIFIIFCTTGTLCLVFVPKLIELRRNPQGTIEKRGARATVKPTLTTSYKTASQNENSVYHKTKVRNAKLRKELRNLDDQIQKLMHQLGEDCGSLAKDGASFSFKVDSDCRVPSVSGADTMSLSSLISSPEATTFTSPHHAKENGGSAQPSEHAAQDEQNAGTGGAGTPGGHGGSGGQTRGGVGGTGIGAGIVGAGGGSGSADVLAPGSVAMWTAISNPLLLISHVLRKSMELPDSELNAVNAAAGSDADVAPASQCEFIIERHATPDDAQLEVHWLGSQSDSKDVVDSAADDETTETRVQGNQLTIDDAVSDTTSGKGSHKVTFSRCACHSLSAGRGVSESFSLNEIRLLGGCDEDLTLLTSHALKNRSISFEGMFFGRSKWCGTSSHSRSDSSFNHESNMSEETRAAGTFNFFDYRSLESLQNSSNNTNNSNTDCNSIQVNFDDESPVTWSPKDILDDLPPPPDDLIAPPEPEEEAPITQPVEDADDDDASVSREQATDVEPSSADFNHWSDQSCGTLKYDEDDDPNSVQSNSRTSWSTRNNNGNRKAAGKSRSTRERRRHNSKRKSRLHQHMSADVEGMGTQCTVSNPDLPQKRCRKRHNRNQKLEDPSAASCDQSILPIFKQLIAQKHQEIHQQRQPRPQAHPSGCDRNRIDNADDDDLDEDDDDDDENESCQRISSCPNLSIKCDVVEYF